jgi:DNA repair protein RadD
MPVDLLDPELLDERACLIADGCGLPYEEAESLARFWHAWTPDAEITASIVLRAYQREASAAGYAAWAAGESVVLSIATGGGKSLVIADLCRRIPGRILVVTHRAELLVQNSTELQALMGDSLDYGLYCAGLNARDSHARVVFASIASIYRKAAQFQQAGKFQAILCDECHRIPFKTTETSMYRTLLSALPGVPVIGLTATPSRLSIPCFAHPDAYFSRLAYHVGMTDLTPQYLAPLVGVLGAADIDVSTVHTVAGEYNKKELSEAASEQAVVEAMADEVCILAQHRKSWLVFCVDKTHVACVTAAFVARGIEAKGLTDDTPSDQRAALFAAMKAGTLRCLVNCEIATTGSNIPRIDCVVLLRPTQSKELVVQCLGRGSRKHESKQDCVILDYSGNLERHAPLDGLPVFADSPERAVAKQKREAEEDAARKEAEEREAKHARSVFEQRAAARSYRVRHVTYARQVSKSNGKAMLAVQYLCEDAAGKLWVKVWQCLEHTGFAQQQALAWLGRRTTARLTVREALAASAEWAMPTEIRVVDDVNGFTRVLEETW